jgi:hypothetical protein
MMARNFFEEMKQIIDDRTKNPGGLVANLNGTIAETIPVSTTTSNQTWYGLTAEVKKLPTMREFVDAFTHQRLPVAEISSLNGATVFPETGQIRSGTAVMLFTSINVSGPDAVPIRISAAGHAISIFVDDAVQAQGVGVLETTLSFSNGMHFIGVICFGSTNPVEADVDEKFGLTRGEPTPPAPHLIGLPVATYLAAKNGSFIVDLSWHNDAYASAWGVYRSQATPLGKIFSITEAAAPRYVVRVVGLAAVSIAQKVFTSKFFAGEVSAVTPTTQEGADVTDIEIILDSAAPIEAAQWEGNNLLVESSAYGSLGRVTYSGDPVIAYQDLTVRQGGIYLYRVTAFGFIVGIAESDYSEPGWVLVDDLTPPGDITFDINTDVRIVNGEIQLQFHTPIDEDYHGVKVFLEDSTDPTIQDVVNVELGLPDEDDQISWRPPRQGNYWLRTFDWAGNVQEVGDGVLLAYDGNARWSRAIQGVLIGLVNDAAGTVALSLQVDGIAELFPATVTFFQDGIEDEDRIDLDGHGLFDVIISQPGTIGSGTYPLLGAIKLPENGLVHFWARIEDKDEFLTWADTQDDLGISPDGTVVVDDYLPFPSIAMLYDEDVQTIVLTVPDPQTGLPLGTRTYTRANGLQAVGGGIVIYTVGSALVGASGPVSEKTFVVDGTRDGYKVEYKHGETTRLIWQGKLHGVSSKAPALQVRYELDEVLKSAVDVFITVVSPTLEPVTLEFIDDDDLSLPIWQYVIDDKKDDLRYLDSGHTTSFADWWRNDVDSTGPILPIWKQKLNNIPLKPGQTRQILVRGITKDSKIPSSWMHISLPLSEVPEIAGVNLTYDELSSDLSLAATGGVHCLSARFELSDDETFAIVPHWEEVTLVAEQTYTSSKGLLDTERGKTWYGRVIPFNGAMSNGTPPTVSGLGGIPQRDSVFVPGLVGNEPLGLLDLSVGDAGEVSLRVTPQNNTLSFQYLVSDVAQPIVRTGATIANFVAGAPLTIALNPPLLAGKRRFVTAWFFEKINATGGMGHPITADISFAMAAPPYFDSIVQIRNPSEEAPGEIRIDFQIVVVDPIGRGGSLKVWTAKNSLNSANPAAAPEQIATVLSTPATFGPSVSLLNGILSNASKDKIVYFEFVNTQGQTTGKKDVKVTTEWFDVGPDGKINPGAVTYAKMSSDLSPYVRVSALPSTGKEGDAVILLSDGQAYIYFNGHWVKALALPDLIGQISTDFLQDKIINTAKLADNIAPLLRVTVLPATGKIGDVVLLASDSKIYRWDGTAWTANVPTTDLYGSILADQIHDGAINMTKVASGLKMVQILSALPAQAAIGDTAYYTVDGKLYRFTAAGWISTLAAADITGFLATGQIAGKAITRTLIGDGAIDTPQLTANAVTSNILAAKSVIAGKLEVDAVQAGNISASAITSREILVGSLNADRLYAGTIQAQLIQATNLAAGIITADKIYAGLVQANLIQAVNIATDAIRANHIKGNEITGDKIAGATITGTNILGGTITAAKLNIAFLGSDVSGVGISQNLGIIVAGILYNNARTNYIDLNATGTGRFISVYNNATQKGFYITAAGTANFSGDVFASQSSKVYAGSLVSSALIPMVSDYIFVYGRLQGSSNPSCYVNLNAISNAGVGSTDWYFIKSDNFSVAVDGTVLLGGKGRISMKNNVGVEVAFISLSATGTSPILSHPQLQLLADGSAIFKGQLTLDAAASTYGWSDINFASSGGTWGALHTFYATSANYGVALELNAGGALTLALDGRGPSVRVANADLRVGGGKLYITDAFDTGWSVQYTDAAIGTGAGGTGTGKHWLSFAYGGGASSVRFMFDGRIEANDFTVYSPHPPKHADQMTASDWIWWAAADATKPVWPHKAEGMPHHDHPEVKRRAKVSGRSHADEVGAVEKEYRKDLSKMAIGVTNWAHLVMNALEASKDFKDFKRRLGV